MALTNERSSVRRRMLRSWASEMLAATVILAMALLAIAVIFGDRLPHGRWPVMLAVTVLGYGGTCIFWMACGSWTEVAAGKIRYTERASHGSRLSGIHFDDGTVWRPVKDFVLPFNLPHGARIQVEESFFGLVRLVVEDFQMIELEEASR